MDRAKTGAFELMPKESDIKLSIEECLHTKKAFVQKGNLESLNSIGKVPDIEFLHFIREYLMES